MKISTFAQVAVMLGILTTILYVRDETPKAELPEFTQWKALHAKSYDTPRENSYRQSIYLQNKQKILDHDAEASGYTLGETQFMDLTQEQFVARYLKPYTPTFYSEQTQEPTKTVVGDIDWVSAGAVGPVINQGQGGNAAIVASEAMTSITKIRDGTLRVLPPQTLLQCAGSGGFVTAYYSYVEKNGMPYNYTAKICVGPFKISGFNSATNCAGVETNLNDGTVAVAVDATNWALYKSGIFSNCNTNLNHATLLVGMTSTYWRIKNSWGTAWGEGGYIRLAPGDTCGLCRSASRPKG